MFRFSVRELFLITAIVGLVMGWGLDHWKLTAKYRVASDIAHSLEDVLLGDGWKLEWTSDHSNLRGDRATRKAGDGTTSFDTSRD